MNPGHSSTVSNGHYHVKRIYPDLSAQAAYDVAWQSKASAILDRDTRKRQWERNDQVRVESAPNGDVLLYSLGEFSDPDKLWCKITVERCHRPWRECV